MSSIEERNLWFDNDNKIPEYVIYYLEKFGINVVDNGLMMGSRNNHQGVFMCGNEHMVLKRENIGKSHDYIWIIRPSSLDDKRSAIIGDNDMKFISSKSSAKMISERSHLVFSTDCYSDTWWTIQAEDTRVWSLQTVGLEKGIALHLQGSRGISTIVGIDSDNFGNIRSYISIEDAKRGKSTKSRFLLVDELPAINESFKKYTDGIVNNIVNWLIDNIDEERYAFPEEIDDEKDASCKEIDWGLTMINDPRISEVLESLINNMPRTKEEACEKVAEEQGISIREATSQYDLVAKRIEGLIENGYAERAVIDLSRHVKEKK